ncbi:hypothetical protein [Aeromicrobium massiliense]|uniref:hypothetical protein n=1 Tax=Aeromicrobium massiliense TaxID=1464554 RepID=UPI0002DCE81A|nr:hypothetical protein [Aeromicrobium massiliense]
MKHLPRRAALSMAATALVLASALSACGPSEESAASSPISAADAKDDLEDIQKDAGVPEECAEAFPLAMTKPDLADVKLVPASWPEPPVDATLCSTSELMDGSQESLDYATEASADEVLEAYKTALADFGATIDDQGTGIKMVVGEADGTSFQVRPQDGGFIVFFAKG